MIKFKKLSLKNFMSFGNAEEIVDLTKYNMTLIQGINKDKEDEEPEANDNQEISLSEKSSNGSGKCLQGKTTINIEVPEKFKDLFK